MSYRDTPIFSKWIFIVPIVLFFSIMMFGLAFHDPTPSTNAPFNNCNQLPTASTGVPCR